MVQGLRVELDAIDDQLELCAGRLPTDDSRSLLYGIGAHMAMLDAGEMMLTAEDRKLWQMFDRLIAPEMLNRFNVTFILPLSVLRTPPWRRIRRFRLLRELRAKSAALGQEAVDARQDPE